MPEGLRTTKEGVLHLGTSLSSESQFAAAATRSSISVMICPPLSLFVITATPYPFNRCIARFARNPQLDPSCVRYHPSPRFSITNPMANGPSLSARPFPVPCRAKATLIRHARLSEDSSEIDQHSSAKPISVPVIPIWRSERRDAGDVDCGGSDRNRQGTSIRSEAEAGCT